jgi:hypothetical protein
VSEHRYDKLGYGARGLAVASAPDGGFAISAVYENSPPETEASACYAPTVLASGDPQVPWYIRTDANGNVLWDFTFGADNDEADGIIPVAGGGFALAGVTSQNAGPNGGASLILFPELSWLQDPTDATFAYGIPVHVDLNATSAAGIASWSINDTARFGVNSNGVISNATALPSGYYPVRISVSDTVGNVLSADITIRMLAETTTTTTGGGIGPTVILVGAGIAGAAIVIIIVATQLRGKKS